MKTKKKAKCCWAGCKEEAHGLLISAGGLRPYCLKHYVEIKKRRINKKQEQNEN